MKTTEKLFSFSTSVNNQAICDKIMRVDGVERESGVTFLRLDGMIAPLALPNKANASSYGIAKGNRVIIYATPTRGRKLPTPHTYTVHKVSGWSKKDR